MNGPWSGKFQPRRIDLARYTAGGKIESACHGAAGVLLVAQGKFEEAIAQLEEDAQSPLSLKQFVLAYERTGNKEQAGQMAQKLAPFYEPTIEQALVVPEFRKSTVARQ